MVQMKTIVKFLIAFVMPLAFIACSSDDEPATKTGDEQVAHLRSFILGDDGEIVYPESSTNGVYILPAASEKAHSYTEAILDDKWNGESQTYKLADNKGAIKIANAPKEGVFVSLVFNVPTIPPFTLEIASEEYYKNANAVIHRPPDQGFLFRCNKCGKIDRSGELHCTWCGSRDVTRL